MTDGNWKKFLLSSGTPLEFETAQLLAKSGFYVNADYEYVRREGDIEREFSVDISATLYRYYRNRSMYDLELLLECKYRSREKTLLFFQDPNEDEFAGGIPGHTLAYIDQFCPYFISAGPIYDLESELPFAYKVIEIHEKGAYEKDIRHAVQQLKFAAPFALRDALQDSIYFHSDDRRPKFMARVLVSNAPLRVLDRNISISAIENSPSIHDISKSAPIVILKSGVGPELKEHYKFAFSSVNIEEMRDALNSIEYQNSSSGKKIDHSWDRPYEYARKVVDHDWPSNKFLQQIFVVNSESLSLFLDLIASACAESYRTRRKSRKKTRF